MLRQDRVHIVQRRMNSSSVEALALRICHGALANRRAATLSHWRLRQRARKKFASFPAEHQLVGQLLYRITVSEHPLMPGSPLYPSIPTRVADEGRRFPHF